MYEPGRTLPPAMRKYLIDLRDELRKEPLAYRDAIKELRRRALNATARWQRARHGPHEQQRWDDLRAATAAYDRARGARTSYEGAVWRINDLLRCASSRSAAQCTGYVYLFRPAPELDVVKIGWTNNPERRLRNLRAAWNKALPAIHLEKWAPCTAADFAAWCPAEPDDEWRIQSMFREFSLPYVKNESRGHDWFAYNPEMQRLFELNLRLRDGEPAHRLVHLVEFLLWDGLLGDQSALRRAKSTLMPEHSMKDVIASCIASASGTAE